MGYRLWGFNPLPIAYNLILFMNLVAQINSIMAAMILLTTFGLLVQRRMYGLLHIFAWQGFFLSISTAIVGYVSGAHHLYISSIFFTAGHASQMHGTQEMDDIKGLFRGNPLVGWGLMFGVMAIVGMPPFGVFVSEFLILTATMRDAPILIIPLLAGLGVAFAALFMRVQPMVAGAIPLNQRPLKAAHIPVMLHLILVLILGLYMPDFLSQWFHTAAGLLK